MLEKAEHAEPADTMTPEEAIKDPFVLEFLNLKDEYSDQNSKMFSASRGLSFGTRGTTLLSSDGQQPYWPDTLYRAHLCHVAKANGEDIKTVQELLRHANVSVTMNVYAQGVTALKRHAHSRIVRMVTRGTGGNLLMDANGGQFLGVVFVKSFVLLASPTGFEPVLSP
jgi:hypothetical protein